MSEIPEGKRQHRSIAERARDLREEWNLPPEDDRASEIQTVAVDWSRPAKEATLLQHYAATHPELKRVIVKATLRDQLTELQTLFAQVQERDKEIRADLDEIRGRHGAKKSSPTKMFAKGVVQCGFWGCTLAAAGKRHEHTAEGGVIGWEP